MHRLTLLLLIMVSIWTAPRTVAAAPPNVLFIAVDDLNDWLGCLDGHSRARTPNLDRLAARGMLFSNAHCAAPACNPSRAAVFSGRLPSETKVWSNRSSALRTLQPDAQLLPMAFADAGYRTLGTGKLLHSGLGSKRAFQEFFGVEQRWSPFSKRAVEYQPDELPSKASDNPRHVLKDSRGQTIVLPLNRMPSDRRPDAKDGESFDWGPLDVDDGEMGDTRITDWAIEQLGARDAKPFFLGVGYYRPHIPLWAPSPYFERFADSPGALPKVLDDDLADLGAVGRQWALEPVTAGSHATVVKHQQWQAAVEGYLACVTYVDAQIGRLVAKLDESAAADNTIIVVWSDHGWHLGEKQHWGKWTGWERSTRVPLIIVPPRSASGFAKAGSRCEQPVSLIDLYPTLAELCAVKAPDDLNGQSLAPLLREPQRETGRAVRTEFDEGNLSLRTRHWRYIRYQDGSEELYDHRVDPHEWHNLADKSRHQAQLEQLRRQANSRKGLQGK